MKRFLPLLFALAALPASAGWKWNADEGFLEDPSVAVPAKPSTADEYAAAGEFRRAAALYAAMTELTEDPVVKRVLWLRCGDARLLKQDWGPAFDAYQSFLAYSETHVERLRGVRFQVEACIMGVRNGAGFDFFGILRGAQWAAKHGRELLTAYAYEDWSASARLRFAGALIEAEKYDEGIIEYEFLLTDFPDSPWTPSARFKLGEAHLAQFGGIPYDRQPLSDARREFRRYLDDYANGDRTAEAKLRLKDLDELEAERDWTTYEHYKHVRKWRSARLYLKEILRKYPATSWSDKARDALPEMEERVAKLPPLDREAK